MPDYDNQPDDAMAPASKPGEDAPKPSAVEIDVPAGFKPPESDEVKDGVVVLTCDWKVLPGGKRMRLLKLGDFDLPDEEAEKPRGREEEPNWNGFAGQMAGEFKSRRNT